MNRGIDSVRKFILGENCVDKKAFQSKTNRLLADRCMGYIMNKFEQVLGSQNRSQGVPK